MGGGGGGREGEGGLEGANQSVHTVQTDAMNCDGNATWFVGMLLKSCSQFRPRSRAQSVSAGRSFTHLKPDRRLLMWLPLLSQRRQFIPPLRQCDTSSHIGLPDISTVTAQRRLTTTTTTKSSVVVSRVSSPSEIHTVQKFVRSCSTGTGYRRIV